MVDVKKTPMTKEQADRIRLLRVTYGFTWRALAGEIAKDWPELGIKTHNVNGWPTGGYQSEGMDLCTEAAKFFGENAGDEPWN